MRLVSYEVVAEYTELVALSGVRVDGSTSKSWLMVQLGQSLASAGAATTLWTAVEEFPGTSGNKTLSSHNNLFSISLSYTAM